MKSILNKKQQVLAAAKELFYNVGYTKARMQDIAKIAQVSIGTVKYYFPTKIDVASAVTYDYFERIHALIKPYCQNDSLLLYMVSYNIFARNIHADPHCFIFNTEYLLEPARSKRHYENLTYLYLPIAQQFNLFADEKSFYIKMLQIFGAHVEIRKATENNLLDIDSSMSVEITIDAVLYLLGIQPQIYNLYKDKTKNILSKLDYSNISILT